MADLSQLELNGTTYNLKDATARGNIPAAATNTPKMNTYGAIGSSSKYAKEDHMHPPIFGTCATTEYVNKKVITCSDFPSQIADGTIIYVYFTYANQYSGSLYLNVNSTGDVLVRTVNDKGISSANSINLWVSGEVVGFVYHEVYGTPYWFMLSPAPYSTPIQFSTNPAKFTEGMQYMFTNAYNTANSIKISNVIEVVLPNVSSSTRTFNVTGITADHQVIQEGFAYFSNPGAVGSDLTLITSAGQITINGTLTGVTDINVTMAIIPTAALGTAVT